MRSHESAAVLATPSVVLTLAGCELDVSPIRLGELSAFSSAARPVFELLRGLGDGAGDALLFDLLQTHTADLARLIACGARVDESWVLALSLDDAYTLAEAVVDSNRDFFIRRLLPLLAALGQATSPFPTATGATPS